MLGYLKAYKTFIFKKTHFEIQKYTEDKENYLKNVSKKYIVPECFLYTLKKHFNLE